MEQGIDLKRDITFSDPSRLASAPGNRSLAVDEAWFLVRGSLLWPEPIAAESRAVAVSKGAEVRSKRFGGRGKGGSP